MAREETIQVLFDRPTREACRTSVFAVLDGASVPGLPQRLYEDGPEHLCLWPGDLEPDLAEVAPYLVRLERESGFTRWLVGDGFGRHWGIFAAAEAGIRRMRAHCRKFLTVDDPEGKPLLFRYYDPRVLRVYLPSCNESEWADIFSPVQAYLVENEGGDAVIRFTLQGGVLQREDVPVEATAPHRARETKPWP